MGNKIKLLYYGDSPTVATGFGTVTRNILTGLHKTGRYDIKCLGVNYWGDPHDFPYPIWPIGIGSKDPYGRQRAFETMMQKDFEFDVLFMLQDSFILEFMSKAFPQLRATKNFASMCYFPVDGVPKASWMQAMNMFDVPVAYTQFGKREALRTCPQMEDRIKVIPHGANTKDFFPINKKENELFRKQYFGKNASKYLILNVNRNQQRKDIPRTMAVFKEFKKHHPDSLLVLHCAVQDQGWNLGEVANAYGLKLNEDITFPANFGPNQGYPREVLNNIYNACDVVVSTSLGEGWGLAQTEAMAAKTLVISPDNTACTEIIGHNEERGFLADSGKTPTDFTVLPHDNEVIRPLTDVNHMVEKLILARTNPQLVQQKVDTAYKWVTEEMEWQKNIVPQWVRLLDKLVLDWVKKSHQQAKVGSTVVSADVF